MNTRYRWRLANRYVIAIHAWPLVGSNDAGLLVPMKTHIRREHGIA